MVGIYYMEIWSLGMTGRSTLGSDGIHSQGVGCSISIPDKYIEGTLGVHCL